MHHLLAWPLTLDLKIVFASPVSTLSTITCCDTIDILLYHGPQEYLLASELTGCQMSRFKKILQQMVTGNIMAGRCSDAILFGRDRLGNVLVEIRHESKVLSYSIVSLEMLQSWAAQLDLLEVVMQENENEKKSRGTGCCG